MDNCIYDSNNDETIGFYEDLKKGIIEQAKELLDGGDYENARDMADLLSELEEHKEDGGLLVLSDNNGMGWGIRKYKEQG